MEKYRNIFDENGYVLIKDFFTEDESKEIVKIADEIEKWPEQKGKWMFYFEKNKENKYRCRVENFVNYHDQLNEILETKLFPIVDKICGEKMLLFKDKLNWKRGGGKGFKAHQDHPAWTDFEPNKYVTLALFANISNEQNGCLQFGKNTNNSKITELCPYNSEGLGQLQKDFEENLVWSITETGPRDILFFDSFVPHRSFENKTENPRRIFYFTFNSSSYGDLYDRYLKKKRIEFPPDIERENKKVKLFGNKYNLANPTE